MLPNLCEITFKVKVNTNLNEHVRIVGSIEPLGLWDPACGLKLTTNMNEYPYWSSSVPLVLQSRSRFEFKVVIFEQNVVQRWEKLPDDSNRRYKVKFAKSQLNCVEGDPVIRENVLEKLQQTISSTSITMDNKVLRKKTVGKVPFNPFSIAASDDDDEDKDSDEYSPSIDKRSPGYGFSSDDEEAFTFNLAVIKTSFYHSPSLVDQSFASNSQNVDHGEKMKELYSQMRSQAHNRLWHLSSKYTFHDAFYGVNEEDLTIFEEQEMVYIVTFYLPVTINIRPDNTYEIKHNYFHESLALYEYCKKYQKNRFLWIGLHQQIPSKIKEEVQEILSTEYGCHAIYLNTDMYNKFKYECKNYLWCHLQKIDIVNKFEESKDFWTTYELVNYRIAEKILSIYDKGYVLINDYRFLLVPSLCVKQKSTLKLHYVLNFPFPSPNSFFCIPFYLQVINSVLLSWVLSFESHDDMTNFVDTVQEVYGGRLLSQSGYLTLQLYGRFIILNANAQLKREYLLSKKGCKSSIQRTLTLDRKASLHLDFEFAKIVFISVDHMSLRGGIEAKFKAIEQLLTMNPEMIGKFQLIQAFKFDYVNEDDEQRRMLKFYENQVAAINEKFSFENSYQPIQIVTNTFQDPKWIEEYYKQAHGFIDTNMDKSYNAHLRTFIEQKEGKAVIIVNEEVADKYTDFPFTFTVNPVSINDITTQLRDCFDIIVNLNEIISCNLYSGRLPLSYVEEWLLKSNMAVLKANLLMRNAKIFNTYVLSKSNTHDYMLAACSSNFKKPNMMDIPLKYNNSVIRVFILPLEVLLTPDALELLKIKKSADVTRTSKDIDPDIFKIIESVAKSENNIVAILTKRSKVLLDNTLGGIKNLHLLAENGCFYKNTKQDIWVNISEDNFGFKEKVKKIMMNYQKRFENFRMKEMESELKLVARGNYNAAPTQQLLVTLQKEIATALGDNTKLEVVRFENSVCVRPYNINRGTTTQILLQKTFQEKGKIGFLFCLGKTPLDEEMLAGIFRTIKMSQEIFTEVKHIFTCAIGHRPSHATYFVNTKEEIKTLLKNLLVDS